MHCLQYLASTQHLTGPTLGRKENFLHAGVDSDERASVELLELAGVDVVLSPPFLLRVSGRTNPHWWRQLMKYQVSIPRYLFLIFIILNIYLLFWQRATTSYPIFYFALCCHILLWGCNRYQYLLMNSYIFYYSDRAQPSPTSAASCNALLE